MDWQNVQINFIFRECGVGGTKCIVDEIAVGKHDAFAFSGSSGSKENHGAVIFRYVRRGGASRKFF